MAGEETKMTLFASKSQNAAESLQGWKIAEQADHVYLMRVWVADESWVKSGLDRSMLERYITNYTPPGKSVAIVFPTVGKGVGSGAGAKSLFNQSLDNIPNTSLHYLKFSK